MPQISDKKTDDTPPTTIAQAGRGVSDDTVLHRNTTQGYERITRMEERIRRKNESIARSDCSDEPSNPIAKAGRGVSDDTVLHRNITEGYERITRIEDKVRRNNESIAQSECSDDNLRQQTDDYGSIAMSEGKVKRYSSVSSHPSYENEESTSDVESVHDYSVPRRDFVSFDPCGNMVDDASRSYRNMMDGQRGAEDSKSEEETKNSIRTKKEPSDDGSIGTKTSLVDSVIYNPREDHIPGAHPIPAAWSGDGQPVFVAIATPVDDDPEPQEVPKTIKIENARNPFKDNRVIACLSVGLIIIVVLTLALMEKGNNVDGGNNKATEDGMGESIENIGIQPSTFPTRPPVWEEDENEFSLPSSLAPTYSASLSPTFSSPTIDGRIATESPDSSLLTSSPTMFQTSPPTKVPVTPSFAPTPNASLSPTSSPSTIDGRIATESPDSPLPSSSPTKNPSSPPTKSPTPTPLTDPPTVEPQPCKNWCARNTLPWKAPRGTNHKCNWPLHCGGCPECDTTDAPTKTPVDGPRCFGWCANNARPWALKCNWMDACDGCPECA